MIRVIGTYRWKDGAAFDHDYYNTAHMQVTEDALASHGLVRLEGDSYIFEHGPNEGDVIAASHAYFESLGEATKAMAEAGPMLLADLPNYTTLKPEIRLARVTARKP